MKITADFTRLTGNEIRPMHGVGQPPMMGPSDRFMHYLTEAGIPYSRLHDTGGCYAADMYVDIPNIFRDFDADENDPASYSFTFTDEVIKGLMKHHCEPIYRLGVTIENYFALEKRRIFPPKDYGKWARICEHVIRHYNEGWANGFKFGITYWEIWNEPDNGRDASENQMWTGTAEEYFELYNVAAKHLKACFGDSIKVGGFASCGFYGCDRDPECKGYDKKPENREDYFIWFAHEFLKSVKANHTPMDFFSWHSYSTVHDMKKQADYCHRMLARYGFGDVEDMLNEWNPIHDAAKRGSEKCSAHAMAAMLAMQKMGVGSMEFYDARIGQSSYGGLFDPCTWQPVKAYYALMAFNDLYKLKGEAETGADDENVLVGGATNGRKNVLLIANVSEKPVEAEIELTGADTSDIEILMIDEYHQYTPTGMTLGSGKLTLPALSCVEIRTLKQ